MAKLARPALLLCNATSMDSSGGQKVTECRSCCTLNFSSNETFIINPTV
jgi:hypothetical protein